MRFSEIIYEDAALRDSNPGVVEWLAQARARPDASELYVHGSNHDFAQFREPKWEHGGLIFGSKIVEFNVMPDRALQAEYYGRNLYLVKFHGVKEFRPKRDPKAEAIYLEAMNTQDYMPDWKASQIKRSLEDEMMDYSDTYLFVPPAVAAGYNFFRIYEVAMRGFSWGVAHSNMVEIVDRFG